MSRGVVGQTKATQSELAGAAKLARQVGEGIALNLTRLLNEIESQVPNFQGAAGTSFQNTSAQLSTELRNILTALNTMADNVDASNQQYGTTDADASAEIAKVDSTYLPGAGGVASSLRGH